MRYLLTLLLIALPACGGEDPPLANPAHKVVEVPLKTPALRTPPPNAVVPPSPTATAGGTSTASPTPQAEPTLAPLPPPLAGDVKFARLEGTVLEEATGLPVSNACAYAGPAGGCPPDSPRTDTSGVFVLSLPVGFAWPINIEHEGYKPLAGQMYESKAGTAKIEYKLLPRSQ